MLVLAHKRPVSSDYYKLANLASAYTRDGWHIGYEVEMEGIGIVNVYGETDGEMSGNFVLAHGLQLSLPS